MAKAATRKCAVPCCTQHIPAWLHFCKEDYRLVPKALKDDLHVEWLYMKKNALRSTERQIELIRAAIAAVMEKRTQKAAKRGGARGDLYQQRPAP